LELATEDFSSEGTCKGCVEKSKTSKVVEPGLIELLLIFTPLIDFFLKNNNDNVVTNYIHFNCIIRALGLV
jgi:hypothetical protein